MLDIEVMTPSEIDDFLTKFCERSKDTLTVEEVQKQLRWISTVFD